MKVEEIKRVIREKENLKNDLREMKKIKGCTFFSPEGKDIFLSQFLTSTIDEEVKKMKEVMKDYCNKRIEEIDNILKQHNIEVE